MPYRPRRKALFLLISTLAVTALACTSSSGGGGAQSDGVPDDAPTGTPTMDPDAITHPAGADEIVLRYEEGGGFMMAGYAASMVPHFTLYGDGTIVFRDPMQELQPPEGSVVRSAPMSTARLTEEQVQDLLTFALGEGGLATARPEYRYDMIADASTAIFTINAGGNSKSVSVYALGIEDPNMPDAAARAAFAELARRLVTLDQSGVITATDYEPVAYRGVLLESPGVVAPDIIAWPWDDIAPADFTADADPEGIGFPHRTMTPTEVDELGIEGYAGGIQNAVLAGPDGATYTFALRPLLPDETE
jgi:hypothetical protein